MGFYQPKDARQIQKYFSLKFFLYVQPFPASLPSRLQQV
jgi:hypothetical protein